MNIPTHRRGVDAIIAPQGSLDATAADDLAEAVQGATANLEGDLIIDLGRVDYLCSAVLRVIVMARRSMKSLPGSLEIVNTQAPVRRVFELCGLRDMLAEQDRMRLRIWGARGSIPSPLSPNTVEEKIVAALSGASAEDVQSPDAVRRFVESLPEHSRRTVGGNTACVEVRVGRRLIILDAGTGIRSLGATLMPRDFGQGNGRAHLLFSHTHWDHIMGLPFFAPAYVPGNEILVAGGHPQLEQRLRTQQGRHFFPVALDDMGATFTFRQLTPDHSDDLDGVTLRTARMCHPGGSFSYRLEYGGKSLIYATDVEFKDFKAKDVDRYMDFFSDADVLIFDSQYTLQETVDKQDWGHSSPMIGAEISAAAGVKTLLLFHHEPTATDERLAATLARARDFAELTAPEHHFEIDLAREGLDMQV